jgi:bifunctional non-homologous end joining protein LigD
VPIKRTKAVKKSSAGPTRKGTAGKAVTHARDIVTQLRAIERERGDGMLDFGRQGTLHVSSLEKEYFPENGTTKGAVMRYYATIWTALKPHVADRPLVLKRYPDGVDGPLFFQQNAGTSTPEAVRVETIDSVEEGPKPRFIGGDLPTLLYTVQLGAIEVHPWLSRAPDINSADRCLIDLDPGDDVPFSDVVGLARDILDIAERCGLVMAVKMSGASGIHLVMSLPPRTSYDTSAELAMRIARVITATKPDRATVERSIKARPAGTIYVDAMQNARGKSMAAAYSIRAKPAATVSAPLRNSELTGRLKTEAFTTRTVPARVRRLGDLWGNALAKRPTARVITRALAVLQQMLADETEAAGPARRRHPRRRPAANVD